MSPKGVCIVYVASHLAAIQLRHLENPALEAIWIKMHTKATSFVLGLVYRAPNEATFFDEFTKQLESTWLKYKNLVLVGDFNVNFLDCNSYIENENPDTQIPPPTDRLKSILSQFGCSVVNKEPTRVTETTATLIDLVVTNNPKWIRKCRVLDLGISDHKLVSATLSLKATRPPPRIINTRNYKLLKKEKFQQEIQNAPLVCLSGFR